MGVVVRDDLAGCRGFEPGLESAVFSLMTHCARAGVPFPGEVASADIRPRAVNSKGALADEGFKHDLTIGRAAVVIVDGDVVASGVATGG